MVLASLLISLSACQKEDTNKQTEAVAPAVDTSVFDSHYLDTAPSDAQQISAIFAGKIQPGTDVVISGEIMGKRAPLIEGRAMFLLGDPTKMTPCNRIPGDGCKTPWDACCDPAAMKRTAMATIQLLDEDGSVIKTGLKGYRGIAEQSFITVKGTIAEGSNEENLLINATGFHAAKESPYKDAEPVSAHDHDHD